MEISAVMNIHDYEFHTKKDQIKQPTVEKTTFEDDAPEKQQDEKRTTLLFNEATRQQDMQARTNRVERQVDVQASRETMKDSQSDIAIHTKSQGIGDIVDLVT